METGMFSTQRICRKSIVLLLAKLTPHSGNKSTADRIKCHLLEQGNTCELLNTMSFEDVNDFREYLAERNIQCVIGIHLWRAGKLLIDCPVPFTLIFGGTDLNEHCKEIGKLKVMTRVVKQAKNLVAFSHTMACRAKELWPDMESKVIVQPQAVLTRQSGFSEKDMITRMKEFAYYEDKSCLNRITKGSLILFLLVAGLRPVKDPTFLFKSVSEWHEKDPRVYFVVVGPEIDPEFSREVKEAAKQYPGVVVIPAMSQSDLHAAMKYCAAAVVNSSSSEGMASAILEAMDLETPVLARRIPGNESLIKHNENGLLFDCPEEFVSLAKGLVSCNHQRDRLTLCGKRHITNNHSMDTEKETYCSIIATLMEN